MSELFLNVIRGLGVCMSRLVTERSSVTRFEKLIRGTLLVPLFGAMLVLLRLRAWVRGPLQVEATTRFEARFACFLPDLIQTYLYVFGIWEPDITAYILRRLSSGDADTFVDVGANIGYHTLLAASRLETGRVVAIEASPRIARLLGDNLLRNGNPSSVRLVNKAASNATGTVTVYEGPVHNVGLSTTVRSLKSRGFNPEADVDAAPLADLLEPHELATTRLVKIDVEGGEDLVLEGMKGFLEACPRDLEIVVELSPQWWGDDQKTPQQVLQPLFDAGFHAFEINNNLWPWRYLWPNDVRPPRRVHRTLTHRVKRLDLVLSRSTGETL